MNERARRILVVEDDPDFRDTLRMLLEEEGFKVEIAENGRQAMLLLKSDPDYCLILLDLMMPDMNGPQFRIEQSSNPRLAMIPVVLMSAQLGGPQLARVLRTEGCLIKPISRSDVLGTIERVASDS